MLATANTGKKKIGRGFGKYAGEWTKRVEISKEEIPGSKRSMYDYTHKVLETKITHNVNAGLSVYKIEASVTAECIRRQLPESHHTDGKLV